uniref:Enoyl reductase (ER) domain-containing protein n=1 Tax=Chlamydomonas leiostraca TaxID=1034604 RepID=A0A7S0X1P8_9CHLO|eukprot:CAMPEP_0202864408 /NCGR_PEP_ID=MMETSP1391-20130828/4661_1 /ASSEMBLY_ACC=CAM_ASM_000867 /TAXON_ID=1034604 /ORGANISM="Chlamydomonas leiostraca, Strain SAG 11-49" /LENGTH=426 /DNA_ID=CAMNT_0049544143 /DNA_START=25 /DNA_END=1305 /DNA_ORIENTATION=-
MPRITARPSAIPATAGREFAILKQLEKPDGSIDAQLFEEYNKRYGNGAAPAKDELSFEEFCALFKKPALNSGSGEGDCAGWAAQDESGHLAPWRFNRRATGPHDVRIQITHAGMCHSDLHQVRNEWKGSKYPMVPGHEIVGIVTEVGSEVKNFKVGDRAGVGCLVNSCQECDFCLKDKEEQYCSKGMIGTYNSVDKDGTMTYGGYSTSVVVNDKFVLHVPDNLPLADSAPLLCAGITVYSPIRHFGFDKPGMHVGVVGLGGLGHMAVKFLKALGVKTTIISTSPGKKDEALKVLGADAFLVSKDETQMAGAAMSMDGLINTVSAPHDLGGLLNLLKTSGTMVCVGAPPEPPAMPTFNMIFRRLKVAGSLIGGIRETQEMLDFCGQHNITCMSEVIPVTEANKAYDRMLKSDVRYRFVIDIQGSLIA